MAAWGMFAKVICAIGITAAVIIFLIFFGVYIGLAKVLKFFKELF